MKSKVISIDPDIMHGTPVFIGTRVPVSLFFDFISLGGGLEEFIEQYPTVKREQLVQLLAEAEHELVGA
jgi:uncharacterized protein (DUF433 family)